MLIVLIPISMLLLLMLLFETIRSSSLRLVQNKQSIHHALNAFLEFHNELTMFINIVLRFSELRCLSFAALSFASRAAFFVSPDA